VSAMPARPLVYHITHVDNLPSILDAGGLWSDAAMIDRGGPSASIGIGNIKQRRLRLPVKCHPGDFVGDYVPFYFCPRSNVLYLIHCANHPELAFRSGQRSILHLEADLHDIAAWADGVDCRWAYSLSSAGAAYAEFRNRLDQLGEVDWAAVTATDFRPALVKEGKQAEFLVHRFFPWHLVRSIGVQSETIHNRVARALVGASHRPKVIIRRDWYY
jgi:hypothetical protein